MSWKIKPNDLSQQNPKGLAHSASLRGASQDPSGLAQGGENHNFANRFASERKNDLTSSHEIC